jgi:O-antigen/teichoic acid export membrane protein
MLGIVNYGTKNIAQYKDNKEICSEKFSIIYTIQFIASMISLFLYIIYLLFFVKENFSISAIQIIAIISCFLDINWLFFGFEDFKFVVIRNIAFRLLSVVLILTLVKVPSDLWIYTLIMTMSVLLSNFTMWFKFRKYIKFNFQTRYKFFKEIKPIILLFIPLLALSIYHIMDKTMLGMLSDYDNVGFYYNADKVINIPIGIITGISTVLFPRSVVTLKKSRKEFQKLLTKGLEGTIIVAIAISFGIAAISKEFTPIFFGK